MPVFSLSVSRRTIGTLLLVSLLVGCGGADRTAPGAESRTDSRTDSDGGGADAQSAPAATRQPGPAPAGSEDRPAVALFFGDSITAGFGIGTAAAFPALVQDKLEEADIAVTVVNAGNSGETSAGGLRRIDWFLDDPVDLFLLELGANDGLRGVPVDDIRRNLQAIIDRVRAKNPDVVVAIAGMQIPPNMGPEYSAAFARLFPELAEDNDAILIPFLLEGVAGDISLNLSDRIHPNERGHQILAETVWKYLDDALAATAARR